MAQRNKVRFLAAVVALVSSCLSVAVADEKTAGAREERREKEFFALRRPYEGESLAQLPRNLAFEIGDVFRSAESRNTLELGLAVSLFALPFERNHPDLSDLSRVDRGAAGEGAESAVAEDSLTSIGRIGGNLKTTFIAAGALYGVGALSGERKLQSTGQQAMEALLLTDFVVGGLKLGVGRERPNGEDHLSFPSGHTAATFALATVLERNYGLRVGVPAYAFAGFVAFSRVHGGYHHWSDVVFGAAVGIAVGRAVFRVHGKRMELVPLLDRDTQGIALNYRF